jgi:hypothetical protein
MDVRDQIEGYIAGLPPARGEALRRLHERFRAIAPGAQLWFLDGRNAQGKVVSNPNIGYGAQTISYADGGRRDFYRVGLSANTSGLSVYVMGLEDKTWLARTCGTRLGKAKVTGYCISVRSLEDIDLAVLEEVVAEALGG